MEIKPNCANCYYCGYFKMNEHLACCNCTDITEPTVIQYDSFFKENRQFVKRNDWYDECDCEHFIPRLSESNGDYEIDIVHYYTITMNCPFCGEEIYIDDIEEYETKVVTCDECGKKIAVEGKGE